MHVWNRQYEANRNGEFWKGVSYVYTYMILEVLGELKLLVDPLVTITVNTLQTLITYSVIWAI